MIEHIAPTVAAALGPEQVTSLDQLRESFAGISGKWKPAYVEYTDHSVVHSDTILQVVEQYLAAQDKCLTSLESYALVAAIYLHDIGLVAGEQLRDERGQLPIQCWPPDMRRHHPSLSAAIVLEAELQAKVGLSLVFPSREVAQLVADLCRIHGQVESLRVLEPRLELQGVLVRPQLLGALLLLGDALHTGSSRVTIENLGLAQLPLRARLFWYSYVCIESVHVAPPTIALSLVRSPEIDAATFRRHVRTPIARYFDSLLVCLNPALEESGFSTLALAVRTRSGHPPGTDVTRALLTTAALEKEIRTRNAKRKEAIARKIRKKGLIEKNVLNNEFIVLRRWSSYTPRMPDWSHPAGRVLPAQQGSLGGGYFLVWNKTGIVIDPGYDFLRNFWIQPIEDHSGFELSDISAVVISHAHDDHSHDIEPIVSLCHKRWKVVKGRKRLRLFVSEATHCKYERLLSIADFADVIDLVPQSGVGVLPADEPFLKRRGVSLEFIRTEHNEMPWMRNHTGVALKIRLANDDAEVVVGYTSDTRYFEGLPQFFSDVDVLVMHFGNMGPLSSTADPYDKNHLGLNGCHDLLTNLNTSDVRLFLLGEFGEEEIGNDRIKLCSLLARMCSLDDYGKVLLPMDVGMRVQLPTLEFLCQEHSHWVPHDQIVPHLPVNSEKIVYYC